MANSNIDKAKRRLKRFASDTKKTVSDAKKAASKTVNSAKSTAKKAVNDTATKGREIGKKVASDGKTIGKQMTAKLKELSSQGKPSQKAAAPKTTSASASKPSLGSKAMSGLKGGAKWGGITTAAFLATDIIQQYSHGGWAQVKAAMPAMLASYGSAAVATALGSALGSMINPGVGTFVGAGAGMAANAIVNYLMEGQPEQVKKEVARGVQKSAPTTPQQTQANSPSGRTLSPRMVSDGGSTNIGTSQPVQASDIQQIIIEEANRAGVDPALMLAIANQESGFNPNAVGDKNVGGSYGLFQIHKPSHPDYTGGFDPRANAAYASKMMKGLLAKYGGDMDKAIMAYNAGGGNVDKGTIPASTRAYLANVKAGLGRFGNVVPRGQGNDTLANLRQPLTGQVSADVQQLPSQSGVANPIAYGEGQLTGGAASSTAQDVLAALKPYADTTNAHQTELATENLGLMADAAKTQQQQAQNVMQGSYTPREATQAYIDLLNKLNAQNKNPNIPYNIDMGRVRTAMMADEINSRVGRPANSAQQMIDNYNLMYQLEMANAMGVPPSQLTSNPEVNQKILEQYTDLLKSGLQYGGYNIANDNYKNMADIQGKYGDIYKTLSEQYGLNQRQIMSVLGELQKQDSINAQNKYNTDITSKTNIVTTGMSGQNTANTAKIQGEYNLQGERMKLEDPYNQFKAVSTGAQALQYDPASASSFIKGIDPRILGTVAPGFNPDSIGGLNPQAAPAVGNPVQNSSSKFYDILKESQSKRNSF